MLKELVALRELQRKVDHALEHSEKEKKATTEDAKVKLELHNQLQLLVTVLRIMSHSTVIYFKSEVTHDLLCFLKASDCVCVQRGCLNIFSIHWCWFLYNFE